MGLNLEKNIFRSEIKSILNSYSQSVLKSYSLSISRRLIDFLEDYAGVWGGFAHLSYEPNISSVLGLEKNTGISWSLPRVSHGSMDFFEFNSESNLEKSSLGVYEPDVNSKIVNKDQLVGLLIPAIGYSLQGRRLGHGKGYFDKFTENLSVVKVGVVFDFQVFQDIPFENHDMSADYIITNERIIKCCA